MPSIMIFLLWNIPYYHNHDEKITLYLILHQNLHKWATPPLTTIAKYATHSKRTTIRRRFVECLLHANSHVKIAAKDLVLYFNAVTYDSSKLNGRKRTLFRSLTNLA